MRPICRPPWKAVHSGFWLMLWGSRPIITKGKRKGIQPSLADFDACVAGRTPVYSRHKNYLLPFNPSGSHWALMIVDSINCKIMHFDRCAPVTHYCSSF